MPQPSHNNHRTRWFIAGLLLICIVYVLFITFFGGDAYHYLQTSKYIRHLARFGSIVIVWFGAGWVIRKLSGDMAIQIWNLLYTLITCLLLLIGFYDWVIHRTPMPVRNIADSLQLFLISPIPYVVVRIIDGRMV